MKAITRSVYGAPPQVLRFEEVPTPKPAPGEVLVKVHCASVNTADIDDLMGTPISGRMGRGLTRPKSTAVGLDVAGVVEKVGSDVRRLRPGDEIWADLFSHGRGAFSEYVCAPAAAFPPKPAGISFEEAATVPHSGVLALQGLRARGGIAAGDSVLINGAGGLVGPFAIQIAKSMGAEVTGVDHTAKLDLMRSAGADHVVDFTVDDVTRTGARYDRILDIAANRSFLAFRRSLESGGVYVLVARNVSGFLAAAVFGSLLGLGGGKRMGVFAWEPNRADDLRHLGELIERGDVSPIVDRTYTLAETAEAIARVAAGEARGKVLIEI